MAIRLGFARDPDEIVRVQRARYEVYRGEEEAVDPRDDELWTDAWDSRPRTHVRDIVAYDEAGRILGGIRALKRLSPDDTLAPDLHFDFGPHFRSVHTDKGAGTMFFVRLRHRKNRWVARGIMSMLYAWFEQVGIFEIYGVITPSAWPACEAAGATRCSPEVLSYADGRQAVPFHIWAPDLEDRWLDFIRRHKLRGLFADHERLFVRAGEVVVEADSFADEAYLVVDGTVCHHDADTGREVRLSRPCMFGDLAMLRGERHGATVVAETDAELVVVDRATYLESIARDPRAAVMAGRAMHEALLATPDGEEVQVPEPLLLRSAPGPIAFDPPPPVGSNRPPEPERTPPSLNRAPEGTEPPEIASPSASKGDGG